MNKDESLQQVLLWPACGSQHRELGSVCVSWEQWEFGEALPQHSLRLLGAVSALGEKAGAVPGDYHSCRHQHVVWLGV